MTQVFISFFVDRLTSGYDIFALDIRENAQVELN